MDLTEAFAPSGGADAGAEDLGKTDFFDFVVSPPLPAPQSHCSSTGGISDEESYLHRTSSRRGLSFDDSRDIHSSSSTSFLKETNNNTLTALPPVSTITGSLNHHGVRTHCIQSTDQIPMDQSECDYWGTDDSKEQQTCNILLEDLNKYCWSAHTNAQCRGDTSDSENTHRVTSANQRQNTDGAIYTLTVLDNEANSMDGLECCKSPVAPSSDSWSLRPNLDLDAILSLEPSHADQQDSHDVQSSGEASRSTERYHIIATTPSSQYATDDSGFVESKELCRSQNNPTGDNNNDWKLSDQNHLQEVSADSAESLLRNALQGKLYSGPTQITLPSSTKSSTISVSLANSCSSSQMIADHHQQQQQQQQQQQSQQDQQDESMHACTEEDLLLSQLETTTYRPGDYEKLKSIANEVVESYCNLEPVCNVSATTTVMYTLDPTSGSLGTITLPADLGHVGTVTVVTAAQPELIEQTAARPDDTQSATGQMQVVTARASKPAKKYSRRGNRNNSSASANGSSSGATASANGEGTAQGSASGSSPNTTVPRKERSLHYCSICSKGFKDKYSVNVHIRTHTGEKPFACSLCGKSFRQKAHLAKHYQTHVTQKPNVGNGTSCSSSTSTANSSPSANSTSSTARGSHATEAPVCSPTS